MQKLMHRAQPATARALQTGRLMEKALRIKRVLARIEQKQDDARADGGRQTGCESERISWRRRRQFRRNGAGIARENVRRAGHVFT